MADAEVIPLGTRGKPGRGTGSSKPSSAARNLAAPAAGRARRPRPVARSRPPSRPERPPTPAADASGPEPPPAPAADPEPPARRASRADPRRGPRPRAVPAASRSATGSPALTAAAVEVFGDRWEPRLAEFLAFLRRRVTGDFEVDEYGFDAEVTERFLLAALRPIAQKWFRVEVRGAENIPAEGGALVVSNHSGTVPLDGLMTMVSIHDTTGRNLRPLGADLVFRMPFVGELARKGGATLACNEDAQRMLSGGELVGVWPEGFKGIGKPYSDRYKLQRFGRGGFVSAAIRTGVPIVPVLGGGRRGDLPAGRQRARRWPGCSACPTSRSRRSSRCSARSAWCRCRRSG